MPGARFVRFGLAAAIFGLLLGCASVTPVAPSDPSSSGPQPSSSASAGGTPMASIVTPTTSVPSVDVSLPPATLAPTLPPATAVPTKTPTPKPTAAAVANLVVTKFEIDADFVLVETPFDALMTVRNSGNADAGPFVGAVAELNTDAGGQPVFDPVSFDNGLAAGASKKVSVSVTVQEAGNWKFSGVADLQDDVNESNENDNTRDVTVKVLSGLPDLAWFKDGFSVFDQGEATADGNKIELTAKFDNVGTAAYNSSSFFIGVTWYRDEDSASGDLSPFVYGDDMQPGATAELSKIDYLPGPGSYTLYALIDDGRVVDELSEDNNEESAKVTIE